MSRLGSSLASPAILAIAQALLHFLWQGALVGLASGWLLSRLASARASTRYAVALGALLLMAALPGITALQLARTDAESAMVIPAAGASAATAAKGSVEATPASAVVKARSFGSSLLVGILGLWLAGVVGLAVYHLGGWRLAKRLAGQGRPVGEGAMALARDLCRKLQIRRAVAFLESSAVAVPAVVGWLRPIVLVPASALSGLSPSQLEAILAHELAHVQRHDYLVNLLQTAIETLLFYHPAVWWLSAQVRRERENCCDDLAVAVCGDRLVYARALVDLEGLRAAPRLALAASGGSLTDRVRRLVEAPRRPSRRPWVAGLLALALLPAGAAVQFACSRTAKNASPAIAARDPFTRKGRWTAAPDGGDVRLELTLRKSGWGSWTSVDSYPRQELIGLTSGPEVRFELRRDAGIFRLRGSFDGRRGSGAFTFTPNPAFAKELGYSRSSSRLIELAVQDVSFDFIRQMRELGIDRIEATAQEPRTGGGFLATIGRILDGERRGTFVDRLVQLRIHRVTPEYVRGMTQAGLVHLQPWQLIEFRNHGIEPDYVAELAAAGYRRLLPFEIIQLYIHGVSSAWLRGVVEAGYANARPEQLIQMYIHGLDGNFIRRAQSQGHHRLTPEELIALNLRGSVRGRLDRGE